MDFLIGFLAGVASSVLVGLLLWALLPRGIALTRKPRVTNFRGEQIYDTWEIRNESPHKIRITGATVAGASTYDPETDEIVEVDLPLGGTHGVSMRFDDLVADISQSEWRHGWHEVVVPPGDTLEAIVPGNTSLKIRYRRAGKMGMLDRRSISIDGGP